MSNETIAITSRHTAALIMRLVYGIKCTGENDPYITMSENVVKLMSVATTRGLWLVDSLPWCRSFPRIVSPIL